MNSSSVRPMRQVSSSVLGSSDERGSDRRIIQKALEKAVPLWEQAQKYLEDNLGTDTLKEFTSLLSEIESLTD